MIRSTLIGFVAVLLWASLALFTTLSGEVPPLLLNGLSFAIATLVGLLYGLSTAERRRTLIQTLRLPPYVLVFGTAGLFGFHALYFASLRLAPPVEANLLNYLWPLLIVLCSGFVAGRAPGWRAWGGAVLGLIGTGLIVIQDDGLAFDTAYLPGYALALCAALFWTTYSLAARRFAHVPTLAVTWYCFGTSILSFVFHLMFETTVLPQNTIQWVAVFSLGLGPVGIAFFFWDEGMKRGDVSVLGAAAYAAPLLSTLLLIAFGQAALTLRIALACLLITAGAALAASSLIGRGRRSAAVPDSPNR
ncbi:DMT family transporter [Notoacmeibacter sp. MSK16QG-6]|uniref:aromatic amino acid exporter YddG n=1 Tax=Notoacmeibacter sp. MSK16QG-6 TaxID=2957982 RepID=UPI00209E11CC|nr:EamA family transporter [Notoacmeibacter sp. MSK16QG-6]MCP1199995.1 EamA family transporter [Notoacmeibacter sp. MSK16QG-6]